MPSIPYLRKPSIPVFTALPTGLGASDHGALIILVGDQTNGVSWLLTYRYYQADGTVNPSAYKWEAIAPAPLVSESTLNEGQLVSTTYANQVPALTLPFAGDWDIEAYTQQLAADAVNNAVYFGYKVGAAAASDADAAVSRAGTAALDFKTHSMRRRKTGIAANTSVVSVARVTAGSGYTTGNGPNPHGLRAWPVRLG